MKHRTIVSWNVNGIRACANKGFLDYLQTYSPDILCIQEIKALESDLVDHLAVPSGYHSVWVSAEKKGYSGVAILSKEKPINIVTGIGIPKFDSEGRVVMAEFENFCVFSVYFPNGQRGDDRLQYKGEFYQAFFDYCDEMRQLGKRLIICGDYNTAHTAIDLARPKENEGISGFLPIEREWMDAVVARGYVDTFRKLNSEPKQYSWWSYRANARQNNVGWRIDYVFVSDDLMPQVSEVFIQQSVMGSDHCPVGIRIEA